MNESCEIVAPVFDTYKNILTRFIKSRVRDPVDSEEILSEVMLKLYDHCEKLEHVKSIESWLITIARNTVIDYFREKQKQVDLTQKPIPGEYNPEDDPEMIEELSKCVPSLMKKLPEKYAQPLMQYEMEGIPQKTLASMYQMSESGLKSRIQRGRKMLRGLFTEYCNHIIQEQEKGCDRCDC